MVRVGDGEYFLADDPSLGMFVYGECRQGGVERLVARCYSEVCPDGEAGYYPVANIVRVLSVDEFEQARRDGWPR